MRFPGFAALLNSDLKKRKIGRNVGLAFVLTGNYDISVWYPWKAVGLNFLMHYI